MPDTAATLEPVAFDEAFAAFFATLFVAVLFTQNAKWSLILALVAAGVTFVLTLVWGARRSTPESRRRRNGGSSPRP